ncbi:hypothetical protein Gohar_022384, partial [Gossypium harknessii]|nr:hypothetical protein [Gossypium harknessii]
MEQPLLSEKRSETEESERLRWYQYVGRTGSVIPTTSLAGADVSIKEIRSATSFSGHYPPSIHAPFINSPEPLPNVQNLSCFRLFIPELTIGYWVVNVGLVVKSYSLL